ncbi:class II fructose-bisphosphate aldolase [Singulisphaera sp. PoT]|uniref:class II fructose-bisphosphate aldolase n=1 Tax=Singulisphaera sp. PoT TaxID=3411797 RepID=UPI003BF536D4
MSLEPIGSLLGRAARGKYAIGYFESWNLESLQGVIDAAEETRSPIIIGFNGDFLSRPTRKAKERLAWYAALGKAAAESASVPCGFIFNECPRDEWVREAVVSGGFNLVMPADPEATPEEWIPRVSELTRFAHSHGIAVEAELGELPCGAEGGDPHGGDSTDPETAAAFVEATGIDLLAISVGNIHIQLQGEFDLDLGLVEAIQKRVSIPLVLHGGTGISEASLKAAIALGVAKVNYGTYVKQRYLKAIQERLASESLDTDPHHLLGIGGEQDLLVAGRRAVRDAVLERIHWLGCVGKADERGDG